MTANIGFLIIYVFRLFIVASRHSLFFFWVGLEVNIISILPLLSSFNAWSSREIALKYFISQRVASILFLFRVCTTEHRRGLMLNRIILIAIWFKLGVPPVHSWLVGVVISGPFNILFILLFMQKFAPLHILSQLEKNTFLLSSLVFLVSGVVFFWLKNVLNIRAALLVSAWVNTTWIIFAAWGKAWFLFLLLYGVFLFSTLEVLKLRGVQKFARLIGAPIFIKLACLLNFLNLAGLPPFRGFLAKLFVVKRLVGVVSYGHVMFLVYLSLMALFTYLIVAYYRIGVPLTAKKGPYRGRSGVLTVGALMAFPAVGLLGI